MERYQYDSLPPVAKTLLIPLGCRAREADHSDVILRDPRAVEAFQKLEGGSESLKPVGKLDQVFTVLRARQFDNFARYFLNLHPDGLVVDIGCGLDTRFERLDNGRMHWLGLDLPEVITLRRQILPDGKRIRTFAGSMLDRRWLEQVDRIKAKVIFLAEGVFCYFTENQVRSVVSAIVDRFPGAELAFDILSIASIKGHNLTSGVLKQTHARLNWGVNDPLLLEAWGLKLVDVWGYFDQKEPRLGLANLMRFIPAWRDANRVVLYKVSG
jgi:O-methyltransferase involved in polyketide biosynthesis